ncbi:MAG TPA: tripartite tricarboxylate transporter TctB family protein, partial [Thermodesulfobacteriota bacterium]|nr:tripartite tricarboxylate transporter TctB family protein [Thermodesulfobacteriota bacterium]
FLVLLGAFVAFERRVLPLGTNSNPGPGYFPLILAIIVVILGGILFLRGGKGGAFRSIKWPEGGHAAAIFACCIFATLGMEVVGYRITMMGILFFLLGIIERLKLWQTCALTVGLAIGSFYIFDSFLKVPLPRGAWGF